MTWETLLAQHEKELADYAAMREKRKAQLQKDQRELLTHCRFVTNKGRQMIKDHFSRQYRDWLKMETDELDQLKHAQQQEMSALQERLSKRDNIILMLQNNSDKFKITERGR